MSRKDFKIFQKSLTKARKVVKDGDQFVTTLPVGFMKDPAKHIEWAESIGMKFIETRVSPKQVTSPSGYPCCGTALIEKVASSAAH